MKMIKSKKQVNSTLISRSYIFTGKELVEKLGLEGQLSEIGLYEGIEPVLKREAIETNNLNQEFEFLTLEQK